MSNLPILVSGRVRDPRGRPLEGARVYLVDGPAAFPDTALLTGPDGGFRLAVGAPGGYALECAADGYQTRRLAFRAEAGSPVELSVTLDKAPTRRGTKKPRA